MIITTSQAREKSWGVIKREMMKLIMNGPEIVRAKVRRKKRRHSMNLLRLRVRSPLMRCFAEVSLIVLDLRVFNLDYDDKLLLNYSILMLLPW